MLSEKLPEFRQHILDDQRFGICRQLFIFLLDDVLPDAGERGVPANKLIDFRWLEFPQLLDQGGVVF